jgi:hypothetical protein
VSEAEVAIEQLVALVEGLGALSAARIKRHYDVGHGSL